MNLPVPPFAIFRTNVYRAFDVYWRARCDCGWRSGPCTIHRRALNLARAHRPDCPYPYRKG